MTGAVAIFVKTPGLSPVKTRLAVEIGEQAAESFHLASARVVAAVVQQAARVNDKTVLCYYAVAEQSAMQHQHWRNLPCVWQGEGGLGQRMATVYQLLLSRHDFVILVGADSPQMTVDELNTAFACLFSSQNNTMVFGPSVDGGFWLFGGNCDVPLSTWTGITYSAPVTGRQFLGKIKQAGCVHMLTTLLDVDRPEDIPLLAQTFSNITDPLPEQTALMKLLESISIQTVDSLTVS